VVLVLVYWYLYFGKHPLSVQLTNVLLHRIFKLALPVYVVDRWILYQQKGWAQIIDCL